MAERTPGEPDPTGGTISPEGARMLEYLRTRAATLAPAAIRTRIRAAAGELEAALDGIDAADVRRHPLAGEWSIAQVVDHVAQTNARAADELRHLLQGRRPPAPPVYEALTSGAAAWAPWDELLEGLRSANEMLDALLAMAEDDRAGAAAPTAHAILVVNRARPDGAVVPEIFPAELPWKEYALVQRLHLLDHRTQVQKLRAALARRADGTARPRAADAPAPRLIVEDRTIPPGGDWAGVVRSGQVMRIVDLEGQQAVDFLCYNAADPSERYNAADTMKLAGTVFLTTGHGLYSDMGRRLFTIAADTCGRHDTIGGCCSAESNRLRYGVEGTPNCRDSFLRALGRFGLGKKDIVANVNFFMNVPVAADGRMAITDGLSRPGDYVDLRAETDVLVAISNCPQVYNPCNAGRPTPIRLVIAEPAAT